MFNFLNNLIGGNNDSEIEQAIKDGAILLDVREPIEFKMEKIPGAINIPVGILGGNISKLSKEKPIVIFCLSGSRSSQAMRILKSKGFEKVINGGSWMHVAKIIKRIKS
ncbi:rhodanese-like domain-containing protein [Porphyromonas pogonae]|uniref:rhodanese-like domain-containing protein n=1 Tax=Porphyromonas pogonae TaxID=867595 RepID=UPI002E75D70A|nr:rhodanese-like domain-containing protein [Porphyromonas pogonae]